MYLCLAQGVVALYALIVGKAAHQSGTGHVGQCGEASGGLHQVAKAIVLLGHGVLAGKVDTAADAHVLLLLVARAAADVDFVEGLEVEDGVLNHAEVLVQLEGELLSQPVVVVGGGGVGDSAVYVDVCQAGSIGHASGHQDNVLQGGVVGVGILAGVDHLALHVEVPFAAHVVLLQGDVGLGAVEYALEVYAHHLEAEVLLLAVHHGALLIGILPQAVGGLNEFPYALDVVAELELACMVDGAAHLHHVAVLHHHAVHIDFVAVLDDESAHFKLVDGVDASFVAGLARQPDVLGVGVAGVAAGKPEQLLYALIVAHLIVHGSLDLAVHLHQAVVGAHHDDVLVLQPYVAGAVAVDEVVIDVHRGQHAVVAIDLDVAQCTDVVDAAGGVEGVESRGQSAERIGAGHLYLAHHLHLDGACLAHGEAHAAAAVVLAQLALDGCRGGLHAESGQADGAHFVNHYHAVGRHGAVEGLLACAPHVDNHLVAGAKGVVGGRGHVHVRLKGKVLLIEYVVAEYLLAGGQALHVE